MKMPLSDKMRGERTLYDQPFLRYRILAISAIVCKKKPILAISCGLRGIDYIED